MGAWNFLLKYVQYQLSSCCGRPSYDPLVVILLRRSPSPQLQQELNMAGNPPFLILC